MLLGSSQFHLMSAVLLSEEFFPQRSSLKRVFAEIYVESGVDINWRRLWHGTDGALMIHARFLLPESPMFRLVRLDSRERVRECLAKRQSSWHLQDKPTGRPLALELFFSISFRGSVMYRRHQPRA